jgi:hypothetical protein
MSIFQAVRDEDDGGLGRFPDARQFPVHECTLERIERAEWFVHQQHSRLERQRSRA